MKAMMVEEGSGGASIPANAGQSCGDRDNADKRGSRKIAKSKCHLYEWEMPDDGGALVNFIRDGAQKHEKFFAASLSEIQIHKLRLLRDIKVREMKEDASGSGGVAQTEQTQSCGERATAAAQHSSSSGKRSAQCAPSSASSSKLRAHAHSGKQVSAALSASASSIPQPGRSHAAFQVGAEEYGRGKKTELESREVREFREAVRADEGKGKNEQTRKHAIDPKDKKSASVVTHLTKKEAGENSGNSKTTVAWVKSVKSQKATNTIHR